MKKSDEYYGKGNWGFGIGPLRGVQPKGDGITEEISIVKQKTEG